MTSESRARYHWRYAIGWPIAAVVIGGLAIWRCAAALTEGRVDGWTVVVGILGAIVILVVLLAIPVLRSRRRIQNLRNETSGAFVCTVAVYPEAAQQFCDLAEFSGGSTRHMWGNIWAELWSDGRELRVYGGMLFGLGGAARILARIPLAGDWNAAVERAQQGHYTMNTLQITVTDGDNQGLVNVLPNWSAGVALLPYYRAERLEPFANQLRALAKSPL